MRTLADVEKELKALRRRVNELEGTPENEHQAAVDEIVGNGKRGAGGNGAFGQACGEARLATAEAELARARQDLIDNPEIVDTAGGQSGFYGAYQQAPMEELRKIVGRVYALRHPSSGDDSPVDENTEFVRRSGPF
jgi:hypothetical protein